MAWPVLVFDIETIPDMAGWRRLNGVPEALAALIGLIERGTISGSTAKDVFAKMYDTGRSAADIVAADGLAQISDTSSLEPIVRKILDAHPDIVAEIRQHIADAQAAGRTLDDILNALGPVDALARAYALELAISPRSARRSSAPRPARSAAAP